MFSVDADSLQRSRIPDQDAAIMTAGSEQAAIRRPSEGVDGDAMVGVDADSCTRYSSTCLPQHDCAIEAGRGDALPIRRPANGEDAVLIRMAGEAGAVERLPHLYRAIAVIAAGSEQTAIRRPGETARKTPVAAIDGQRPARLRLPDVNRPARVAGSEQQPIGRPRRTEDAMRVRAIEQGRSPAISLPDVDTGITPGRGERAAIGRPADGEDLIAMSAIDERGLA